MPTFIFPPLLEEKSKTILQISLGSNGVNIYYKDSISISQSNYKIACKIFRQSDNFNIIKNETGYVLLNPKKEDNRSFITIQTKGTTKLKDGDTEVATIEPFELGEFYKIQLAYYNDEDKLLSEWSSAFLLKIISLEPQSYPQIENQNLVFNFQVRFTPDSNEYVKKYKFTFFSGQTNETAEKFEESEWISTSQDNLSVCSYALNYMPVLSQSYFLATAQYITNTGFVGSPIDCQIDFSDTIDSQLDILGSEFCLDGGYIKIPVQNQKAKEIQIQRSEEGKVFKTLKTFDSINNSKIIFKDYFLESGVKYQYQLLIDRSDNTLAILRDAYEGSVIKYEEITYDEWFSVLPTTKIKWSGMTLEELENPIFDLIEFKVQEQDTYAIKRITENGVHKGIVNITGKVVFEDLTKDYYFTFGDLITVAPTEKIEKIEVLPHFPNFSQVIQTEGLIEKSFVPYIEYSSLLDADSLLTLKLNDKISSYKQNTLISKQDTLSSQFPIIMKNGLTNYSEFSLSGLISLHQDNIQSFFKWIDNEGYYYKNELVIPYDKLEQGNNGEVLSFNTNLTPKNFYIERIFREKVIEFLSNGQPKVFRSPSEGNKIVILSNISLTPENSLGRMLYNFSATAYEVDEYNLNNLNKYHFYEGSLSV